ncbi:ABC transporter ATP-binding protein [Gilvimarinus algae]|uniref:ABC transporter ATP-binding protein n=1 Tax=Gilvimarinus algae TaxID=3058037 RepID=A0ABT8TBD8_9GAMM|nr:ABC transporter ATP-binding protein [Gilvimarinus sp. SDUM040014]MDO3381427.1 ABC transporter ATP-binding protein [Gilvimarinus sp. SDUM040014]
MSAVIQAANINKRYGRHKVLDNINLEINSGKIVGLIGPNGAGKTTLLQSLLGLGVASGDINVLGEDPRRARSKMLEQVCFIADTATLPRWMKVSQAIEYVAGIHPRFDQALAERLLTKTQIKRTSKIRELSKGMVTQLHLALVMAVDAKLLVLDEPTLGLDIIYRRTFYDALLNDYYDGDRTILITTHQVEEIEHLLTDVVFINDGKIVLNESIESFENQFVKLKTGPESVAQARALKPVSESRTLSGHEFIFENVPRERLASLGELALASLAEVFVAKVAPTVSAGAHEESGHE